MPTARACRESRDLEVGGAEIDVYLAYLDAVPRIRDVIWEMTQAGDVHEAGGRADASRQLDPHPGGRRSDRGDRHLIGGMEVVVTEPFFEVPFVRERFRDACLAMADYVYQARYPKGSPTTTSA